MRFIKWYRPDGPNRPWYACSDDDRIWYNAQRDTGGGWNLLHGYKSGVDPATDLGWYSKLIEAKQAADHHYHYLVTD